MLHHPLTLPLPLVLFSAFPEDTDDSYSNSPVQGICVENVEKEREIVGMAKHIKEEKRWKETEAAEIVSQGGRLISYF